jgi:methionine synthase II (cobalamin-independent)
MALNQTTLKNNLLTLFNLMKQSEMSEEDYAENLAAIINEHIKTAQVKAGIPVSTTGSAAAQSGATTGTGELI